MKNRISIFLVSLLTVFAFSACEDEQEPFEGPYRLNIGGPGAVDPETTATYTLGDIMNPETYTWSVVEGPGQIVGTPTGASVAVEFLSVGDVLLNVTNGRDARTLTIHVEPIAPAVTGVLDTLYNGNTRSLRSGESAVVLFEFDSPVESFGSFGIASDSSQFNAGNPFMSGSVSALTQVDANTYSAVYTAGEGNGIPEVKFTNIIATEAYGSDTVKNAYVQLYNVDNVDPIANVSYNPSVANDSTEVTVTVDFGEAVVMENPADSAIFISLSGAGVADEIDTLQATGTPGVYTYTYMTNGGGNGEVGIEITNVVDLAGNQYVWNPNNGVLTIDNTDPIITLTAAVDQGDYASLLVQAIGGGTAMYVVVEDGEEAPEAPTTPEEFEALEGVASGSFPVGATGVQILETGDYTVYFLVMDRAGNYSTVESANFVMD